MEAEIFETMITVFMGIITLLMGIIIYHKKARDQDQEDINKRVHQKLDKLAEKISNLEKGHSEHAYKFVTSEEVRSIVYELTNPIASEVTESKTLLKQMLSLVNELKTEIEVQKAIKDRDK